MSESESGAIVTEQPTELTITEVQQILGAKELDFQRLRTTAQKIIDQLEAKNRALVAECERLNSAAAKS